MSWLAPEDWGRAAALAALGLVGRRRLVTAATGLLAGLAAFLCGAGFAARVDATPAATAPTPWEPCAWVETSTIAAVRVRARPRVTTGGRWSAPATVLTAGAGEAGCPGSVYLRGNGEPPTSGSILGAEITVRPPSRAAVPDGFDTANWLAGRAIAATARITRDRPAVSLPGGGLFTVAGAARDGLQNHLRDLLGRGLPPRERGIASGILLGGGTSGDLRDPFARLGLAHLFALSGLHVGILAGLFLLVFRPLGAGPVLRLSILAPLLVGYVFLVDLPGSAVRAAGLVSLALVGPVAGRQVDSLRLLGLLLWINVLWQPAALLDTGTRLSYQAAGGIVAGQRLLWPWLQTLSGRRRALAAGLGVTVAAQIATLPEVARSFGYLPLGGPLANLLLVPVFGLAVTLLATGMVVSSFWPWAGEAVLAWAWLLLRPLEAGTAVAAGLGAGFVVGLPSWGIVRTLGYGLLVTALATSARLRRRWSSGVAIIAYAALLTVAAWRPPSGATLEAWQFAVGQGDAALLRFPDGWTCLVDAGVAWRTGGGPLARDVLPFFRRRGLTDIDAAVLTHGHADHTGGRDALAAAVDVGTWYTGGTARPGPGHHVRPVAGDTLHAAGCWSLVCLHPEHDDPTDDQENDRSLVLGLCRAGVLRALWTGDLERDGEGDLLARLPAVPASGLDVLKAGHHGSATSSTPGFLEQLRPRLVLISCGIANRHRHPSHGPYLAAAETVATVRTDLQGTVHLRWNESGELTARAMWPLPPRLP